MLEEFIANYFEKQRQVKESILQYQEELKKDYQYREKLLIQLKEVK